MYRCVMPPHPSSPSFSEVKNPNALSHMAKLRDDRFLQSRQTSDQGLAELHEIRPSSMRFLSLSRPDQIPPPPTPPSLTRAVWVCILHTVKSLHLPYTGLVGMQSLWSCVYRMRFMSTPFPPPHRPIVCVCFHCRASSTAYDSSVRVLVTWNVLSTTLIVGGSLWR